MNIKYSVFGEVLNIIKAGRRKCKWHRRFPDSDTIPMNSFNFDHVVVGKESYGELNVVDFGGDNCLRIGDYVSIAQNVTFILNAEHYINHVSTFPFKVKTLQTQKTESFGKGDIVIGSDVWIGYGSTILSGINIQQGAVIGAGAVVTKDIPAYAIAVGVPARVIDYRFSEDIIEKLKKIDYSKLTRKGIERNVENLYSSDLTDLSWIEDLYEKN